jgi:APA family basic amino acid/polyamine antiporter
VLAKADIPAAAVGEKLLPGWGEKLLIGMLMCSVFGALSGNILVGPRIVFAVGRDYPAFAPVGRVYHRTRTPARAIAAMCAWAITLVWLGRLSPDPTVPLADILTNYCIFGGSIFYFSAVLALFVLRVRRPDLERPYRTWGYPFVPGIFVVFYIFFLASMLWNRPLESCAGLLLLAIGVIVHIAVMRE